MTATVGTLLDAAHALAWELWSQRGEGSGGGGEDRADGLLAAWPRLAASTLRVLDAVALEPAWLDETGALRVVLAELAHAPLHVGPDLGRRVRDPDRGLQAIGLRLGLIADRSTSVRAGGSPDPSQGTAATSSYRPVRNAEGEPRTPRSAGGPRVSAPGP